MAQGQYRLSDVDWSRVPPPLRPRRQDMPPPHVARAIEVADAAERDLEHPPERSAVDDWSKAETITRGRPAWKEAVTDTAEAAFDVFMGALGLGPETTANMVGQLLSAGVPLAGIAKAAKTLNMSKGARAARAAEQGFNTTAYKGAYPYDVDTGAAITEFKSRGLTRYGPDVFPEYVGREGGYAGFFSDKPEVAGRFAGPEGAVYPVKIQDFKNPVVIDAEGSLSALVQYGDMAKTPRDKANLERMRAALKDETVDGIVLRNTADEGTVYIPKQSNQVRSRFAAFDPSKRESADLMAGVTAAAGAGALASQSGRYRLSDVEPEPQRSSGAPRR